MPPEFTYRASADPIDAKLPELRWESGECTWTGTHIQYFRDTSMCKTLRLDNHLRYGHITAPDYL